MLFLMDWRGRSRVKLWGTAKMVAADEALLARLRPPADYPAKVEQVLIFTVTAWDTNCNQHIPILLGLDEVRQLLAERDARIAALEAELSKTR